MKDNIRIYALGFFDGVHLGHRALLEQCVKLAKQLDVETAAITFEAHPQSLFTANVPPLINGMEDRLRLLRKYGIDHVCAFPVKEKVMTTPWDALLDELVEHGGAGFVCGRDFRFGYRGEGDVEKLKSYCRERKLPCVIVPEQTVDGLRVSSTHIRGLLEQGDMENAQRFLGHPHILTGEVVAGRKLGRTIGIPTANIQIPEGVVVPKLGVYACKCTIDGKEYVAVTNVGSRPTVKGHQVRTESWILEYEGDLYGRELTLEFYKFLRPEREFGSLEQLRLEIHENAHRAWEIFHGKGGS